ncbi:MAG: hypothetical protein JJE55_13195 [Flavobacteriaceae bacterium]|nr:hypothetical protein [Flavobacteriaceae bacterium]
MRILILLIILTSQTCFSQLGKTKTEIFSNEGSNYADKDIQNDFTVYSYSGKVPKLNGELCNELVSYFMDNEYDICFKVTYASCAAAANTYVKFFNDVAVKIEANKWKDYSDDSIYTLMVEGQFAYVEHFYDYE